MAKRLGVSHLFIFLVAIWGSLFFSSNVFALAFPRGDLLVADFRVSLGGESYPLSEWDWPEPWLSPNLEENIIAFSRVNDVTDEDGKGFLGQAVETEEDGNFVSVVSEPSGFSSSNISSESFIASSKIQGYSDAEVLSSGFRMFNVFEASSDPAQVEYAFSFRYGWLFENPDEENSPVEISAGISIVSLLDPSDSFSFGVSNLGGTHDRRSSSGLVNSNFQLVSGVPYELTIWGATQWSEDGSLAPLPLPNFPPDIAPPSENAPVPEPATVFLFVFGVIAYFFGVRFFPGMSPGGRAD